MGARLAMKSSTVRILEFADDDQHHRRVGKVRHRHEVLGGSKASERLIQGGIVTWAADAISSV